MNTPADKPIIVHSLHTYLFRTGSWIYSQIVNTHRFRPIVVATRRQNLEVFPWDETYFLSDLPALRRFFEREYAKRTDFYYPYFYRLLKNMRVALVHSHFGNRGYFDLKLKEKLRVPQITMFYGHDASMMARDPLWQRRYDELFRRCELILAEGDHMRQVLIGLGAQPDRVVVQHLGVDLDTIAFIPRKLEGDRQIKILIASTFRDKKGITYCLEAFANVAQKHRNIHLTIIGDAGRSKREQTYKQEVIGVIRNRRIGDRITMLGFLDYPAFIEEAKKHDIFLSHSVIGSDGETEGGAPVTLIEMSAYGMPVLATLHCDIPEVIVDGKSGFLVPERDVDGLTQRLEYLVEHPEAWEPMGRAGREHVAREYDAKKQAARLEQIYSSLL
ncbi:MAG: glycosyltransferase [Desulfobacterota bacterium]|nr:glycosyltransferase [Thermodesulfobacteriota bacterium]